MGKKQWQCQPREVEIWWCIGPPIAATACIRVDFGARVKGDDGAVGGSTSSWMQGRLVVGYPIGAQGASLVHLEVSGGGGLAILAHATSS